VPLLARSYLVKRSLGAQGTVAEKIETMKAAGIAVAETPATIADTLIARIKK